MLKKAAILIPFYKTDLSENELIALTQCKKILGNHPIIAIKPKHFTLPKAAEEVVGYNTVGFDENYFTSIYGYNQLMLSSVFYEQFLDYEYILIYQLDCFVFKDELSNWCDQGWDYIGAPWIKKTYHKNTLQLLFSKLKQSFSNRFNRKDNDKPNQFQFNNQVGNGGFSLRKVKVFYNLSLLMKPVIDFYLAQNSHLYNEDVFWSIEVNRDRRVLNIPNCETALKFAVEVPPLKLKHLNKENLPFGCHDWDHYSDYWEPVFKTYGYEIQKT
ncbi:DUF5672 family protein [Pedobacter sp. WC2501]|uniref:DUF5672 family protein n=1 Tax=Pedobacter sp. WC2501 TaxID=3461400 RepID=UPI0040464A54